MGNTHRDHPTRSQPSLGPKRQARDVPNHELAPCRREDTIFNRWSNVQDNIVRNIDLRHVQMIGCYRVVTKTKYSLTILVFGEHARYPESVRTSKNTIHSILEAYKLEREVKVDFIEGRVRKTISDAGIEAESEAESDRDSEICVESGAGETGIFLRGVLHRPSMPGQSLALSENKKTSGTLGGFFEVLLPGSTRPQTVGITCFHVIDPKEGNKTSAQIQRIREWRKDCIHPDDKSSIHLRVDHPSPRSIEEKTRTLKREIRDIKTPRFEVSDELIRNGMKIAKGQEIMYLEAKQQLSDHKAFLQEVKSFNPSFGRVWAASGFRNGKVLSIQNGQHQSSTNHDWALIEVPRERIGSNITPDGHVLKQGDVSEIFGKEKLCISGQRSGYSEGIYNSLHEAVVTHEIVDKKVVR